MAWSLILVVVIIFFTWCINATSRKARLMSRLPGPKGWPIVGTAFQFLVSPEEVFIKLREEYKNYKSLTSYYSFGFGYINIYDPEDIETILSASRFNDKQIPYTFFRSWLGEGLLISNGSKWHQRRKLLTSAFHFNILKKYTSSFIEYTENLLKKIENETSNEQTDVRPLLSNATLRIMCQTAMGISMDQVAESEKRKYFEAIHTVGECIVRRLCRIWYYSSFVYNRTSLGKAEAKALVNLHAFTNKVIRERKAYLEDKNILEMTDSEEIYGGNKGRLAMLDLLLQSEKEGNIDLDGIREEVDTFMFEGHDTTAMALSFFVMRIASEPEIQEKMYEELKTIFQGSDRLPTMDDLNDMKYLECCIKESLRLYPSVPFIARYLNEDVVLSGYTVPKDVACHIHIYDLHHREDIYPDAEKFIPERFLPENVVKRHRYAYLPFSAGPRNCIGQKFAFLEMKTVISGLLRKFKIEPVTKPNEVIFTADVVLRSTHPLYVRFRPRK
ncbi:unnamed protein product [Colias eurytheme]|nr:unnamed protein product [Colias eurytheme]